MHARAMGKRRDHQGRIILGQPRHQISDVVIDDKSHLPMGQNTALGPARSAGGIKEPGRMIAIHIGGQGQGRGLAFRDQILPGKARTFANGDIQPAGRIFRAAGSAMFGEGHIKNLRLAAGRPGQIGGFRRAQAEVRRHPNRADQPAGPDTFENRVVIARMDQHAVAGANAARAQAGSGGTGPCRDLCPLPNPVPPDQAGAVRQAAGSLQQHGAQVGSRDHAASPFLRRPSGGSRDVSLASGAGLGQVIIIVCTLPKGEERHEHPIPGRDAP